MNQIIIFCAKYLFAAAILILFAAWVRASKRDKAEIVLATLTAGAIAYILIKIAGGLYYDPRPFVTQHINPLVPIGADNGFPSEHTVFTMMLTILVYYYWRNLAVLAFVMTLAVGISRVLAHVHSPVDIVAGLAIGILAGSIGHKLASYLFKVRQLAKSPAEQKQKAGLYK